MLVYICHRHDEYARTLFPLAQPLDFIGPLDIFNSTLHYPSSDSDPDPPFQITCIILSTTLEPVQCDSGLVVVPDMTYDAAEKEGEKWDAVLVPGGRGVRLEMPGKDRTIEFLRRVVPDCRFVLSGKFRLGWASG